MAHLDCIIVKLIKAYAAEFFGCLDYIFAVLLDIDFIDIVEAEENE